MKNRNIEIINNRIITRSLEIHIVDHCNLRCADCCSLSPLLPEHYTLPIDIKKDLEIATSVISSTYIKLVGGEPLLHPNIIECLHAARPFAKILSITTNGILLNKMEDEFWRVIDALTISIYPGPKIHKDTMDKIHQKAEIHKVSLNIKHQSSFVEMTRWDGNESEEVTNKIYSDCWLRERCHIVDKGIFYQCTRPPHFHTFYEGKKSFVEDGIPLNGTHNLLEEIYSYLKQEKPLKSCSLCQGGSAEEKPHRMLSSKEIIKIHELKA
jgi:organic radical activating enzyme